MLDYLIDKEGYKGFFKIQIIMYAHLFLSAGINYLPQLGVSSPWIPIAIRIVAISLGVWYLIFVAYMVKNR